MQCEHGKCTRTATISNNEYFPNKWYCTFHANKLTKQGRINKKLIKQKSNNYAN